MFKKSRNVKGLTVDLVLGLFKHAPTFSFFAFLWNETLYG